ncbi:AAA family ATPase [Spirosoma foliorum]|uniref:AAA family ATPase n=1 Tax=Spirosoma foliorum TaxID=2710596 RepID=A0A7G5GUD4_9BACT|nr:AAA family ATPase [Spirosoma foliorum]QMW02476.1 AAA family ATPase [Spirosoma foliorum]
MSQKKLNPNTSLNGIQPPEVTDKPKSPQVEVECLKQHMVALGDEVNKMPDPAIDKSGPIDYRALGESLRIFPDEEIVKPQVCLSIQQDDRTDTWATLGNFSLIIGKTKSRKTFAVSIAVAAALRRDLTLGRFMSSFDEDKRNVLYFDTEQGRYHALKVVKRICRLAEQPSPTNLFVYPLRSLSTQQRLGFIRWHIYNTDNVGLVVIDGIRDTIVDINDNAEATERTDDLMRWSAELGVHIITVLHMNKGNDHARGTIGTELQNKAESIITIVVDPNDKSLSVVTAEDTRERKFEPFAFSIDETGLPYLVDGAITAASIPSRAKKPTVDTMKPQDVAAIVRRAFSNDEYLRYAQLRTNIVEASEFIGIPLAKSRSEEFIRRVETLGYINKLRAPSHRYDVYKVNLQNLPL